MNVKQILEIEDNNTYHKILAKYDHYYQQRIDMLQTASELFLSKKKITEMTDAERRVFLGRNTHKELEYAFDTNLFGAPGGNGEVLRIVSSQYSHLDDFFTAIPRRGDITHSKFNELVNLFRLGCQSGGAKKFAFVFLTRILTITRPDFFLSSAAKALDVICLAVGCKKVGTDPEKYWQLLTQYIHKTPLYYRTKQMVDNFNVALLDGVVSNDTNLSKYEGNNIASPKANYVNELNSKKQVNMNISLNQILYGPPGTGKTYHTIEAAVKAAEPTYTWANRDELKAEYARLVADKRIRFVTFHQSYGYEEFVEGLSAKTENEAIKYAVKDGVFKIISNNARKNLEDSQRDQQSLDREQNFDLALDAFKLSIFEGVGSLSLTDETSGSQAFSHSLFEEPANSRLTKAVSIVNVEDEGFRYCGDWKSSQIMKFSDLKVLYLAGVKTRQEIKLFEGVSGLAKQHSSYFLKALEQIEQFIPKELPQFEQRKKQNFVLIIDEINRGNISKIFGELITLIEPSKRKGEEEEIELVLPYSGDTFSVPDNLHIIGTMNTADRSLAMMDTALRRRFDFIEMMPKPELFNNKQIKGIDLTRLLNALNKRIEALYDREHALGHAFLFPAYNEQDEDKAFELLKAAFKNKIIPLLEEYFYDDWNKIRLVLGDNQKPGELRFVEEHNEPYDSLFGSEHGLETYEESKTRYTLIAFVGENSVWDNPHAYIAVYTSIK